MLKQLKRFFFTALWWLKPQGLLTVIEKLIYLKRFKSNQPQIFIFGLPRSGTTLVYQYLVHRLKTAYFTNGVGKYYTAPCTVTFLQKLFHSEYKSDFKSNYGRAIGPMAPREAGGFWGVFFGFDDYVRFDHLDAETIEKIRNIIACIQWIFGSKGRKRGENRRSGRIYVNKNVKHLLRLNALSRIFPNSFFLLVERDLEDVALSVIRGRYKNLDNPNGWWSAKPPNYEELKDLSIPEQVAGQLTALKKKIEMDLAQLEGKRVIRINYSTFCNNPESLVERLETVFRDLEYKNPPVEKFPLVKNKAETDEERDLLQRLVVG